jgi:hypothetical protein
MDDKVINMTRVNQLLQDKVAVQKDYINKLKEEQKYREELETQKLNEVKNKGYGSYVEYDEDTQLYELTEEFYSKMFNDGVAVDPEKTQEVMDLVSELNTLSRESLATEMEIKRLVDSLKGGSADVYNAERRLVGTERRQAENDAEEQLIGRLPEEIQGPLKLANSFEDAWIEYDTIQATKTLIGEKEADLQATYDTVPEHYK